MSNGKFRGPRPSSVAIVAMGASSADYTNRAAQHGGRKAIADEAWAINAMGGIIEHDRLFAMDDLGELRRDARKGKKVANGMLDWLPSHPGPVYVPRRYDWIPGSVEYPIEAVLNCIGFPYLNNSVAYAIAYAMYLEVDAIKCYGCDFTYVGQPHVGEDGRGCVEWLLGIAGERNIHIEVSQSTSLLDACLPPNQRLYGYDEPAVPEQDPKTGRWSVRYPKREEAELMGDETQEVAA